MFQCVRPLNAHTFASLIRCHGALHDSISAVRVLKHFREILHTLSSNDLKYRFTVYQAAHDVCLKSEWWGGFGGMVGRWRGRLILAPSRICTRSSRGKDHSHTNPAPEP